jgi:hypothetical protein
VNRYTYTAKRYTYSYATWNVYVYVYEYWEDVQGEWRTTDPAYRTPAILW